MDVLYSPEDVVSTSGAYRDQTIRYGDRFCLGNCASNLLAFMAIVRHRNRKRSPSLLPTDMAPPGRYPDPDYMWTFIPAAGMKKKCGDPVSFADRVRIQSLDYTGNCRYVVMNPADPRVVQAEKAPCSRGASTWMIASTARLRTAPDGRVLPDGDRKPHLEFGSGNYVSLINGARYLSVGSHPYGGSVNGVSTLPDLPATGMAVWWRLYRSLSDAPSR